LNIKCIVLLITIEGYNEVVSERKISMLELECDNQVVNFMFSEQVVISFFPKQNRY